MSGLAKTSLAGSLYRWASDHLGRFLNDCVRQKHRARVSSKDLFAVFTTWSRAMGGPGWTRNGFGRALTDRGYVNTKSGNHY